MTLEEVTGTRYGPARYRVDAEKVTEYVLATGDDPGRWVEYAPPSFAGALLFCVTPMLLADTRIAARSIIHGEQSFTWHRPIRRGSELMVTGTVGRVRERAGVTFLGFDLTVVGDDETLVEGSSTFLLGGESAPGSGGTEVVEPGPEEGTVFPSATSVALPAAGEPVPRLERAAGRAALVRYAGASRDFNPIHWDHAAAVAAGLPGVVVHGLLQSAWILQAASRHSPSPRPVTDARFRYRAPLLPATITRVTGVHLGDGRLDLRLEAGDTILVSALVTVEAS